MNSLIAAMLAVWIGVSASAAAAERKADSLLDKLDQTLTESRMAMSLTKGKLEGPGAKFLIDRAAASRFVLAGEDHGFETIADILKAYYAQIQQKGYSAVAIELDPYGAKRLETLLRSQDRNALKSFAANEGNGFAFAFYNWAGEAEFARSVVALNPRSPALWGLDQVFIGGAYHLLNDIAQNASTPAARTMAQKMVAAAKGNLGFMPATPDTDYAALSAALSAPADAEYRQTIDDMALSAKIYRPFSGGDGSAYEANLLRENYMKRNFLRYIGDRRRETGTNVKVMFKFGVNHMQRGISLTNVPSLGNFVADMSFQDGADTFHVAVLPGPGSMQAVPFSAPQKGDGMFDTDFAALRTHLNATGFTVFDLTPMKQKPKRWEHWTEQARRIVWSYDAIVIVPNAKPAQTLN